MTEKYCNTLLKIHAQFRKSARKKRDTGGAQNWPRRYQFCAARVLRFHAWICDIARESLQQSVAICFHLPYGDTIVRGVSCVLLGSTEAALMGNFTPISRRPAKCAMRIAWVHSGALRAPLCIRGAVMAHSAARRAIGVKFPMREAPVDPKTNNTCP